MGRDDQQGGYIRQWLLCGPFAGRELTAEERAPIEATGYSQAPFLRGGHLTDYLESMGGEAAARPAEGDAVTSPDRKKLTWKKYVSPSDVVDFETVLGKPWGEIEYVVMYGYATVRSESGGPAYLEIGSDDSAKVYLNGRVVHDAHVRHCTLHRDYVPVRLEKGDNAILVKVENCGGPGGFIVRPVELSSEGFASVAFEQPVNTILLKLGGPAGSQGFSVRLTEDTAIHVPVQKRWE